jgi:hypothetical protein
MPNEGGDATMLNAILQGKKRGTGTEGIRLSEDFNGMEDTLTATVFERLLYLPDEKVAAILFANEIWAASATIPPTSVENVSFWPWHTAIGEKAVEPDLVVEFANRVLVVEAKRNDFRRQQDPWQLAREYARAHTVFPGRQVWMLAVGGLQDGRAKTKSALRREMISELGRAAPKLHEQDIHFAAVAWHELFVIIHDATASGDGYRRLISDIRRGLILHGIAIEPPGWMEELTQFQWRAGISTPPSAFIPTWASTLAGFRPITSPLTAFIP